MAPRSFVLVSDFSGACLMREVIFRLHSIQARPCVLPWDTYIFVFGVCVSFSLSKVLGLDRYFLKEFGCILEFTLG